MGTEDFSYVKPAVGYGENVGLQYAVQGEPVSAIGRAESAQGNTGANVQPAGLFSTAPYVPPGAPKPPDSVSLAKMEIVEDEEIPPDPRFGKCIGNDDTCNAWATKKWAPFCNAHGQSEAKRSTWAPVGGDS